METTMKNFAAALIISASLMLPFAASAQQGSTGANSVGSAFATPAPSGATTGGADSGTSTQVQNSGPAGSTGANNVGSTLAAPAPAQNAGNGHPGQTHQ
jgi:hypothetical protein